MSSADEKNRGDAFATRVSTSVWQETPDPQNPYQVDQARCHGYEHLALINNCSFAEVLFLLFQGDRPSPTQQTLFEKLLISIINPGPRHNATRAAMNAAVSQTHVSHILPIALNSFSGDWQGSHAVFNAMKFLRKHVAHNPAEVAADRLSAASADLADRSVAPGFGTLYGTRDSYSLRLAENLARDAESGTFYDWARNFVAAIQTDGQGWLISGLTAACLLDLGFTPYQGELIFQIGSAPGLAAHGAEKSDKPITDMPFIPESNYVIKHTSRPGKPLGSET